MSNPIVVKSTGEVIDFKTGTLEEMKQSWLLATEYIKAYEKVKDRIKKLLPEYTDERGLIDLGSHQFRVLNIQRMNYDKAILRQVFEDEDLLDEFLEPSKPRIDRYIKEHLDEIGESSTVLREGMVPIGEPFQTIRLEKI